ncbi:MAG: glutamine--fructose-6-phosphate transaminase (isomerizing) [Dehalococcoidia bacterium]
MCGIIAYAGGQEAGPILLDGLKALEYRGYDSAGVGVRDGTGCMAVTRVAGRVEQLAAALRAKAKSGAASQGTVGIAHTRWATHGGVTEANAHPHVSRDGRVAIVHNGIVENYLALRAELADAGYEFTSETDSEVIAHLIHRGLAAGHSFAAAVREAAALVQGASAVVAACADEPETLIGLRLGNAGGIVVGLGDGFNLLASDTLALLPHTSRVVYLDSGEMVSITPSSVTFSDLQGAPIEKAAIETGRTFEAAAKGEYPHFMAKEIAEQAEAVASAMRMRVDFEAGTVSLPEIPFDAGEIAALDRVVVCGMGTSMHAGMFGAHLIEALARIPAQVENASELRYRAPAFDEHTLVVAVTQSGETVDTLAAMEEAARRGARQIALVENEGGQATRVADATLRLGAGQEIAVASTKTMMCSLTVLSQLAVYLAARRGVLTREREAELVSDLARLPALVGRMLSAGGACEKIAKGFLRDREHLLYLGRGPMYAIAMEGALKMKEVAYIHAEGYAAGEMKHGVNALISEAMPTIALAPQGALYDKMVGNVNEVKARGGHVIAIATEGDEVMPALADDVLWLPKAPEWLTPMLALVPVQLLAYHTSVALGLDPDKPRNLAKTVTVE